MFAKFLRKTLPASTHDSSSLLQVDEKLVQLFDTFGFVRLPGYLKKEIPAITQEFDRMMQERYGHIEPGRHYMYPQFADNSPMLTELVDSPKISALAQALCGENYMYKGSDGNIFVNGTPWHRDYLLRVKSIKMLVYLEHNDATSGGIVMLPGSQFIGDAYSSYLTQSLTWPEPPVLGGFDEKGLLPSGNNPLHHANKLIPGVPVETYPGDVIVFNHNIVHCANQPKISKTRRLLGMHFCTNLAAEWGNEEGEHEMEQIKQLALSEMRQFDLSNYYGRCVLERDTPSMRRQTAMLRQLSTDNKQEFDGTYAVQSQESIDFCNINKNENYKGHRFVN